MSSTIPDGCLRAEILSSELCRPIRAHVCAYEHVHFIKTYNQVSRSYELIRARIIYVDIIGLKLRRSWSAVAEKSTIYWGSIINILQVPSRLL